MRVEISSFSQLPSVILTQWEKWISEDPSIQSPFCHPAFSRAVDLAMGNVEVAIAYDNELPVAVLPFQRYRKREAIPVGGYLSNFNGWISRPGTSVSLFELTDSSDIRSYRFHALPLNAVPSKRCWASPRTVVYADVSGGFRAYTERKKEHGSNVVGKLAQKERKISREIGELRLEVGFTDEAFDRLLEWKQVACSRRNVQNILAKQGHSEILRNLTQVDSHGFRHHMTRLMAGKELVAVHLGLICHDRMAAWLPAYNPGYGEYSPGLLVLLQLLRNCEHWNVNRVDFGRGEFFFKDRFKTGESTMLDGIVDKSVTNALLYSCWLRARDFAKSTRLQPTLQRIWHSWHSKAIRPYSSKLDLNR